MNLTKLRVESVWRYAPIMLRADAVTEAEVAEIWPRPSPPDWDYEKLQPYPFHLLHHKFRMWKGDKYGRSDIRNIDGRSDITHFLQNADPGHKARFYNWVWRQLDEPDRMATDPCPGWVPAELDRVHNFFLGLWGQYVPEHLPFQVRHKFNLPYHFGSRSMAVFDALTTIGSEFAYIIWSYVGGEEPPIERFSFNIALFTQLLPELSEIVTAYTLDGHTEGRIHWFYRTLSSQEQSAIVDFYNL